MAQNATLMAALSKGGGGGDGALHKREGTFTRADVFDAVESRRVRLLVAYEGLC